MPKLNQIIAILDSAKKRDFADLSKGHHELAKKEPFIGFIRTFKPRDDEGTVYPEERMVVQKDARAIVTKVSQQLTEWFNVEAAKDIGNCNAKSDIVVGDQTIAKDVPVTYLLFLEKRLTELRTFVAKLPVLDASKEWTRDQNRGMYASRPEAKLKTRKVHKALVKYEATPQHPAQTEVISIDEPEGTWTQIDLSSAFAQDEVSKMLDRITLLEQAVKFAREKANGIDVEKSSIGKSVLDFLFSSP
jgi:hypothetical protein